MLIILSIFLLWFLFIKEYDYRFHFEAKYGPGVVYHEVSKLEEYNIFSQNIEIDSERSEPFNYLFQNVGNAEDPLNLKWEFEKKNDSLTDIFLHVKSSNNKIKNRLSILNPFSTGVYLDSLTSNITEFGSRLNQKQSSYKVRIVDSTVSSPSINCICRTGNKIKVSNKATWMVREIEYLDSYLLDKDLSLTGNPFIKINNWNQTEDLIDFDFCFPVNLAQDIRPDNRVSFRQISSSTAIKAIFNGNYRESHLAWYDLLYKAEEESFETNARPLEIFYNNPNIDKNVLEWKAEIYLPIAPVNK